MSTLEKAYLEMVRHNDDESFSDATFDLVDDLIEEFGEDGIASKIVAATPMDVPWKHTAGLLSIMLWSTSDNGYSICEEFEGWLRECDDERKVFMALPLDVYPFLDRLEMESTLTKVAKRFPALNDRCRSMIASRNKSAERSLSSD